MRSACDKINIYKKSLSEAKRLPAGLSIIFVWSCLLFAGGFCFVGVRIYSEVKL